MPLQTTKLISFPEMPTWLCRRCQYESKKKWLKTFGSWAKGIPQITYPDPKNVQQSQINFVDMPMQFSLKSQL
jgi:hypothetical protein